MARDRTDVHLIIYPYHAQLMAMFEDAGLLGTMDEWKRMLVREADAARARHPDAHISVWDFSGYGDMRCERIPAPGDTRSVTRWYWEAGHFKSTLGELMLQRIFGRGVTLITSAEEVAREVSATIERRRVGNDPGRDGSYRFLCTGNEEAFREVAGRFLQLPLTEVERVDPARLEIAA